jgi:hypothetical protein
VRGIFELHTESDDIADWVADGAVSFELVSVGLSSIMAVFALKKAALGKPIDPSMNKPIIAYLEY